jgi:glucokinase
MNPPLAIGIDLGGTNIKAAVVDRDGNILHRLEQQTGASHGPGPIIDDLADLVRRLRRCSSLPSPSQGEGLGGGNGFGEIVGIGLATPGPLDLRKGRIIHAANLPGWRNVPIRDVLAKKLGLPVVLENDANAAAFGEYCCAGTGRGDDDLVMLTLGTGVGAGVILNGRIVHGHFDNAAELGHMIVVVDGLPCPCGQRGCLEQYASANAITRRVADAWHPSEPGAEATRYSSSEPGAVNPTRERKRRADQSRDREGAVTLLRAEDVANGAANGDPLCQRVWDDACLYLAIACVNIQHAYNPSKIVLGGGLSNAGAQLLDRVNAHFRKHTWSLHADAPEIVLAQLGPDAGVIGAAMLAMPQTA